MQKSGLEWIYRAMQEPSRLVSRYFSNIVGLLRYLPIQIAAMAMQGDRRQRAQITNEMVGKAIVVRIDGDFTGALLPQFESDIRSAVLSGSHVVLDMSNTAYIGADALASLIYVMNVARSWKRELWLAGLDRLLVKVVGASRLRLFFRLAPKVAEALRRIQPELAPQPAPIPHFGKDWAFCRIGGQLIPIHVEEVPDVYRQMHELLGRGLAAEPLSVPPLQGLEIQALSKQLVHEDAG
jgi:anti-anti-sigma factor